jgi:hypothetical protein
MMIALRFRILKELFLLDLRVRRNDFNAIYERVRHYPLSKNRSSVSSTDDICEALNRTCIWYPKPVLCLERSALAAYVLRQHGIPAQMVIGAQMVPFRMHAWVEVDGRVVNDRPYVRETYAVLDRC